MKVADVTYEGPMRLHRHRCSSGVTYKFQSDREVAVSDISDAEEFANITTYDVDWTVHGELLRHSDGTVADAMEAVKSFGYRKKQSLAKSFGIKANQSEEKLEKELKEEVRELQDAAERQ